MIRISKPIVREVDRKVFLVSYMSDNKSKTEVNPNGGRSILCDNQRLWTVSHE